VYSIDTETLSPDYQYISISRLPPTLIRGFEINAVQRTSILSSLTPDTGAQPWPTHFALLRKHQVLQKFVETTPSVYGVTGLE
jgi:hypothetical protein